MGMFSAGITGLSRRLAIAIWFLSTTPGCNTSPKDLDATALGLPLRDRPEAATRGAPRAFLGAAAGELTITAANGASIDPLAGAPLLADDHLRLGADGLAVVIFTTGNVLRLQGPIEQDLRGLAGFDSPPVGDKLETQLVAALSDADRERLGADNERIGGWQLRVTALEAPAPQEEQQLPGKPPAESAGNDDPAADALPLEDVSAEVTSDGKEATTFAGERTPWADDASKSKSSHLQTGSKRATNGEVSEDKQTIHGPMVKTTPSPPPWSLVATNWTISGDKVKVPDKLGRSIVACLRTVRGPRALVELELESGVIRSVKVVQANLKCVDEFKGVNFQGISTSGSIRMIFDRT